MDEQLLELVRRYVRKDMESRFGDAFVFDPILVEQRVDHDGEEYLRVDIVFDGDQRKLDADWTSGLVLRLHLKLRKLGIDSIPSPHFIKKSEWANYARMMDRRKRKVAAS